jgi:tetratricopeptide (TPR) repeat protein
MIGVELSHLFIVVVVFFSGQKENAIKYAQQILDAFPNRSENHLMCGLLYARLEHWDRSAFHFDLYEKVSQDKLDARVQRLEILARLVAIFLDNNPKNSHYNLDHFLKTLEIMLSLEPALIENESTLGTITNKVGLPDDSQGMVYAGMAFLVLKKGNSHKAHSLFTKASEICKSNPSTNERVMKWVQQVCPELATSTK